MTMTRRGFLVAGIAGAAALIAAPGTRIAAAEPAATPAALRFSSWVVAVPGELPEQFAFLERNGVEAVEARGKVVENLPAWLAALRDSRLQVSALDWSSMGGMVSPDARERQKTVDSLKRAIDAAAQLKAPGIIAVPPRLGRGIELPDAEATKKMLIEVLTPLGRQAAQAGTCILVEPVDRKGVNCLHTVAEAAAFCRACGTPGVGIVADFSKMMAEESDLAEAFVAGGSLVRQVHLTSRRRTLPGQEQEDALAFRNGFRGLKRIGYRGFCSFECGRIGTFTQEMPRSMDFLRKAWDEA